jgi:hypothetical protein
VLEERFGGFEGEGPGTAGDWVGGLGGESWGEGEVCTLFGVHVLIALPVTWKR